MARQPGQQVAELGEFDLYLALAGVGALRKDIQDELRSVDDAQIGDLSDAAHLRRSKILIDDQQGGSMLEGRNHDVLELAAAHEEFGVSLGRALDDPVHDADAGGVGQFGQFGQAFLLLQTTVRAGADQDGGLLAVLDLVAAYGLRQLRFELGHELVAFELKGVEWNRRPQFVWSPAERRGRHERQLQMGGIAVGVHAKSCKEIQAVECQVDQVVPRERLGTKLRVDETDASKRADRLARFCQRPERIGPVPTDDHLVDRPPPGEQQADRPSQLIREVRAGFRQLARNDSVARDPPPIQMFELQQLAGL